jgi:hypothetical protein
MLSTVTFQAATKPRPQPAAAQQPRTLREMGAYVSPIDKNVILLPPDKPMIHKPVSSSRTATYTLGGSIAGSLAGTYAVLFLSTALPGGASALAAASLMIGGAALGGLMGWAASK